MPMSTPRLDSGDIRRLARSLAITAFYDFPARFAPGARVYGEMYVADNAIGQTLTLQNHFYQWTTGWHAGESGGISLSLPGSKMVVSERGVYRVSFTFAANITGANQIVEFAIFKNGVYQPDHSMHLVLPNVQGNSGAIMGILSLNAGDVIDLRVQNTSSAGKVFTLEDGNLSCS